MLFKMAKATALVALASCALLADGHGGKHFNDQAEKDQTGEERP